MKITITNNAQSKTIQSRRQILAAPVYPEAVSSPLIAQGESDLATRAFMIFECLVPPGQDGKSFVDFGGDAFLTAEAVRRGMRLEPPHDIVMLYDLLDHEVTNHPTEMLKRAADLMAADGLMIVRCHPWCSRHATHVYRKVNKAYLHLMMSQRELAQLGVVGRHTRTDTLPPTETYRSWFDAAGLKVVYEEIVRLPVEDIFKQEQVFRHMNISDKSLMEIQFVDYVLEKPRIEFPDLLRLDPPGQSDPGVEVPGPA